MSDPVFRRWLVGLILWLGITFLAAFTGAMGSMEAASFYATLRLPDWAPPGWLFGPVWTGLYLLMGVAAWIVWRDGGWKAAPALGLYVLQLMLNALWSWLFFAWRMGAAAMVDVTLLWILVLVTIGAFNRRSRLAALMLLPYLAWITFAAALNLAVWRLNPGALG